MPRVSRTLFSLVAALAVFASASVGLAPQAAAKSAEEEAKQLFLEGKDLYQASDWASALDRFQRAISLVRRSSGILMAAHCYRRMALPDRALDFYLSYLDAWNVEQPGKAPQHKDEVQGYIKAMREVITLNERGEKELGAGQAQKALATFEQAHASLPWSRLRLNMARSHRALGEQDRARAAAAEVRGHWEAYLSAWSAKGAGSEPPEAAFAQEELSLARAEEELLRQPLAGGGTEATAAEVQTPASRRQVPVWLIAGISGASLALTFEVIAWVSYSKGNDVYTTDPSFQRHRNMTIAGHVLAATFAAASGASFYMHYRSKRQGREAPARSAGAGLKSAAFTLVPLEGGVGVAGAGSF